MKHPKFSIIIPAHNEEDVIERAIKSVQDQTFKDFEIIVVNDGSTDKTRESVEKLIKKDKRIKLLNFEEGHSAAFARNRGAEKARGEIFVFLDADTFLTKETLREITKKETLADAFSFPCFPMYTSFMSRILSAFVGISYNKVTKTGVYNKDSNIKIKPPFFIYKRNLYKKLNGYDEDLFYCEDEDLINRAYGTGIKTVLFKGNARQYFELPSTFKEFLRQCKWIGKGINTIPGKEKRRRAKIIWILKSLFLLSPLAFLSNSNLFLIVLGATLLITYIGLIKRNKNPLLSLIALPFFYIKTFLVTLNIFRFWN